MLTGQSVLDRISNISLVPVIAKINDPDDAVLLGQALEKGGIPVAEVTFRMKDADKAISRMADSCPEVLVGAGTVLKVDQVDAALGAGARFIVAPGLNERVVKYCQDKGVPVIPGVATASELDQALELGLNLVKFFPAEQMGGLATIKALCGPYKNVKFIPTGGVNLSNLAEYLAFPKIAAVGGTFMLGNNLETKNWDGIVETCKLAVSTMLGLELAHVGVNTQNPEKAKSITEDFDKLLHLVGSKEGNSSFFAGTAVEVMKSPFLGEHGHLGFKAKSIDRALNYLKEMGVQFNMDTAKYDANGAMKAVYFKDEIGGFAVHLLG